MRTILAAFAAALLIVSVPAAADAKQKRKPAAAKVQKTGGFNFSVCQQNLINKGVRPQFASRKCTEIQASRGR